LITILRCSGITLSADSTNFIKEKNSDCEGRATRLIYIYSLNYVISYPKAVPVNVLMYVGKENCLQRPHVETVDDFPQIILKFLKQN
jgi:hypothetical protein